MKVLPSPHKKQPQIHLPSPQQFQEPHIRKSVVINPEEEFATPILPKKDKSLPSTNIRKFNQCRSEFYLNTKNKGPWPKMEVDQRTISSWLYPYDSNKQFRKYQFRIARTCLLTNTLVCLPTGLGKTLIASTVLYNFYRWFPRGKVFFMTPTRPLVHQQYLSFLDTFPILKDSGEVALLTGEVAGRLRKEIYENKNIIFCTPQTLLNDIQSSNISLEYIVCIVVDEAHRATKQHWYCKIVQAIHQTKLGVRIVGLSATPATTVEGIQFVLDNLCIAKVEVRMEEDQDVKQYIHQKSIRLVRVDKNEEITKLGNMFDKVMDIPVSFLHRNGLLQYKYGPKKIFIKMLLEFQNKFKSNITYYDMNFGKQFVGKAYSNFSNAFSLLQGRSLLFQQGIKSFHQYCLSYQDSASEKKARKFIVESAPFKAMYNYLLEIIDSEDNHPKLVKIGEILKDFFSGDGANSTVIIFTQFVKSALVIKEYLSKLKTNIFPEVFIGQNNEGVSQKIQLEILGKFKQRVINTLIATCIGEEGLDIGYVDLIISYDCTASPIRMIQRFGRTGRQRDGSIIVLATPEEESKFNKSNTQSKSIFAALKNAATSGAEFGKKKELNFASKSKFKLYEENSRMVPADVSPRPLLYRINPKNNNLLKIIKFSLK